MKHTASVFRINKLFQVDNGEKRRKCQSYGQLVAILPIIAVKGCKRE